MNQAEKTALTKQKIINAAIEEFGTKGYSAASTNNIGGIAKGLIYHNFKNKEELYLACVAQTFFALKEHFKNAEIGCDIQKYIDSRMKFFSDNKSMSNIFFEATLTPPASLKTETVRIQQEFEEFNVGLYESFLSNIKLRSGVTKQSALEYFKLIQYLFNSRLSAFVHSDASLSENACEYENSVAKMLDYMLYGIAERGE